METDAILSFRTPPLASERVEAIVSPVLELVYAAYFLGHRLRLGTPPDLAWVRHLLDEHPAIVEEVRAQERTSTTILLLLGAEFGYAADEGVERFLHDLPGLPARLLERMASYAEEGTEATLTKKREGLVEGVERLGTGDAAARLAALLADLWRVLDPLWERDGRRTVREAGGTFLEKFRASEDVLEALPPHHFTQFEAAAAQIRVSQERGHIVIVPLFFASEGGFNFHLHDTHFIGYGVQGERLFEQTHARLTELAARAKAFADPTRLILLTLIARFSEMTMTVGDLADQLGVSQPTVSGHLKVLREAALVESEKRGNKSFYRVDAEAVRGALAELESAILNR